jgi:UDP-4-amino-4-deoxy-L-arabinose-oxoglutarate aminotransferase
MTSGDGGAIAVRDPVVLARLRQLRNHGVSKDAVSRHGARYVHWDMMELGYKAAMTDVEAALLLPQIERLNPRRGRRQAIVERYERALDGRSDLKLMTRSGRSGHHLFTVLVPRGDRDRVLDGLGTRGIGAAVNYRAIHTLSYYKERFGFAPEAFPHAWEIGDRTISLPLWPALPHEDVDRVVSALLAALAEGPEGGR